MKNTIIAAFLLPVAIVSNAAPAAKYVCSIANDHTNLTYRAGENAVFTVTVADTNGVKATSGTVTATLDNFGPEKFSATKIDLAKDNPFSVTGRLAEAGFLRLNVSGKDVTPRVWSVAYDPTHIRAATDRPDDFMTYWKNEKARLAREVPLDAKITPLPYKSTGDWDVSAINFATFGGKRVYGFISVPKDKSKAPFPVRFNVPGAGPGARDTSRIAGTISVVVNVHPYDPLSGDIKELYNTQNKELGAKWNVSGYATSGVSGKREDYFFHDVILGIDRVLDWVAARPLFRFKPGRRIRADTCWPERQHLASCRARASDHRPSRPPRRAAKRLAADIRKPAYRYRSRRRRKDRALFRCRPFRVVCDVSRAYDRRLLRHLLRPACGLFCLQCHSVQGQENA